jgi:hypothetical protein
MGMEFLLDAKKFQFGNISLTVRLIDTIQDFSIKLGIKLRLHVLKISIFSINHVIVRPTKIMNNLLKVCKICTFKVIFRHLNLSDFFSVKNIGRSDDDII